jgi:hypothetical protein
MHEKMQRLNRGVFDKEARRKPLAFAADAVNSTAACSLHILTISPAVIQR